MSAAEPPGSAAARPQAWADTTSAAADATVERAEACGVRFSIVAPLFDLRDAGHRALASALDQAYPREDYEVVAVVGAQEPDLPAALLGRCDRVIAVGIDGADVASEIALFEAGARAARGEYLFFIEGHTVLMPDALRTLARALDSVPRPDIVCGGRVDHARTRLGALIGGNNARHALRAARGGQFTLGANCAIARARFDALGGFDPDYLRFNETVLLHRAVAAGTVVRRIDGVLCVHHDDAPFSWLVRLLLATGRAKSRYYRTLAGGRPPQVRHPVYRWLGSRLAAAATALPLRIAGPAVIAAAMLLVRRMPTLAGRLYVLGVGCTDVAGFCIERAMPRARRGRRAGAARRTGSSLATDYELRA